MLGHIMWRRLSAIFPETFATVRHNVSTYKKYGIFKNDNIIDGVDVMDTNALSGLIKGLRPAFILNCIGITKRYVTDENVADCISLNAQLPHRLAQYGKPLGIKVFNFSTDCVFDGLQGNYKDGSSTNATDIYGKTKALGEIRYNNTLTLRSSFIGRELDKGSELLEWFLSQKGESVPGFRNAIYSGITTLEMSRVVIDIIKNYPDLHGLYNVSGHRISKYDLLDKVRRTFDVDIDIEVDDVFICDRSLDSSEFRSITSYEPPGWDAMLKELAEDSALYGRFQL